MTYVYYVNEFIIKYFAHSEKCQTKVTLLETSYQMCKLKDVLSVI